MAAASPCQSLDGMVYRAAPPTPGPPPPTPPWYPMPMSRWPPTPGGAPPNRSPPPPPPLPLPPSKDEEAPAPCRPRGGSTWSSTPPMGLRRRTAFRFFAATLAKDTINGAPPLMMCANASGDSVDRRYTWGLNGWSRPERSAKTSTSREMRSPDLDAGGRAHVCVRACVRLHVCVCRGRQGEQVPKSAASAHTEHEDVRVRL